MKKTLVIAIVLALVFAIAAPAFAVTPIKLSAKLEMGPVTADDEFVMSTQQKKLQRLLSSQSALKTLQLKTMFAAVALT